MDDGGDGVGAGGETSAAPFPRRHHAVELELNACGVECCPHDAHKGLVAVASYLHQPGDEDTPQSRVGQLYLYDLRPSGARGGDDDADAVTDARTGWSFARVAPPLETRAIFELAWAPASWLAAAGPALAQADAGGFLTLYRVHEGEGAASDGSSPCSFEKLASVQCGGGGLGMATCAAWGSDCSTPAGSRLAVVGADGGLRVARVAETGDLRVTQEATDAHSLEAWAVAFATKDAFHGSGRDVVFSGADDAQLKAWDVRAGLDAPAMRFRDRKTHGAGVTCVARRRRTIRTRSPPGATTTSCACGTRAPRTGRSPSRRVVWAGVAARAVAPARAAAGGGGDGRRRGRAGLGRGGARLRGSATKTSSKTAASPTTTQTKTRRTRFKSALPTFVPGLCVRPAFTTATRPSRTAPTGAGAGDARGGRRRELQLLRQGPARLDADAAGRLTCLVTKNEGGRKGRHYGGETRCVSASERKGVVPPVFSPERGARRPLRDVARVFFRDGFDQNTPPAFRPPRFFRELCQVLGSLHDTLAPLHSRDIQRRDHGRDAEDGRLGPLTFVARPATPLALRRRAGLSRTVPRVARTANRNTRRFAKPREPRRERQLSFSDRFFTSSSRASASRPESLRERPRLRRHFYSRRRRRARRESASDERRSPANRRRSRDAIRVVVAKTEREIYT